MADMTWETPQDFFDRMNEIFHFTVDVCADPSTAKCKKYFTKKDDGLSQDWSYGICWMNPPYDRNIGKWMEKAYKESQKGAVVVCLIQGRSTDTKWWHEYVMRSSRIWFIEGRLQFLLNGKKGSGCNISSVIVVFQPYHDGGIEVGSIKATERPPGEGEGNSNAT